MVTWLTVCTSLTQVGTIVHGPRPTTSLIIAEWTASTVSYCSVNHTKKPVAVTHPSTLNNLALY